MEGQDEEEKNKQGRDEELHALHSILR